MSGHRLSLEDFRQHLFIDGRWEPAPLQLPVINPAHANSPMCYAPLATIEHAVMAIAAAKRAFETNWGTTTGSQRASILRRIASTILERKPKLAKIETMNCGKTLAEALWDMDDIAACFEYYATLAEQLDNRQYSPVSLSNEEPPQFKGFLRYEPVGVVAAIIPWNYPLLMLSWKVAPALAAGCTIVVKPSELTPLTALEFGDICLTAGVPAGVVNIITGYGHDIGDLLSKHPDVDKVAFTGSVPTGQAVMRNASLGIKSISLELGGKSPAIVFDSANIERSVEWAMFGCFFTNGQICSATSRLLVHKSIASEFIRQMVELTNSIRVGDPLEEGVKMGPIVSQAQLNKILKFIEGARNEGATIAAGGYRCPELASEGFFLRPTIITNVSSSMTVWNEEIFGPVLSVMTFSTEEEAIQLANQSRFGLAAAVFTTDEEQMRRVVPQLRCGIVWENCSQPCFCQMPWGGMKQSGIGRELGEFGLASYLEPKQIVRYAKDEAFGWYLPSKL